MAITTSQYIINAGWARTDTIDQLERAWTSISWNGAAESQSIAVWGSAHPCWGHSHCSLLVA